MKAPVCNVCLSAHWSGQPHRFSGGNPGVPAVVVRLVEAEDPSKDVKHDVLQTLKELRDILRAMSEEEFKAEYNVYQAEYMRRGRARRKE